MAEDPFGNFWSVFGENPHQILTTLVQNSLDSINAEKDKLLEQADQILKSTLVALAPAPAPAPAPVRAPARAPVRGPAPPQAKAKAKAKAIPPDSASSISRTSSVASSSALSVILIFASSALSLISNGASSALSLISNGASSALSGLSHYFESSSSTSSSKESKTPKLDTKNKQEESQFLSRIYSGLFKSRSGLSSTNYYYNYQLRKGEEVVMEGRGPIRFPSGLRIGKLGKKLSSKLKKASSAISESAESSYGGIWDIYNNSGSVSSNFEFFKNFVNDVSRSPSSSFGLSDCTSFAKDIFRSSSGSSSQTSEMMKSVLREASSSSREGIKNLVDRVKSYEINYSGSLWISGR